jgi:hypothetical protein
MNFVEAVKIAGERARATNIRQPVYRISVPNGSKSFWVRRYTLDSTDSRAVLVGEISSTGFFFVAQ